MGHQKYKNSSGQIVPSVTTILSGNLGWNKQVLLNWYSRMFRAGLDPEQEKTKAADIGTLVHNYIEAHIYGTFVSPEMLAEQTTDAILIAEAGLEQFKRKIDEFQIEFLEVELPLVSDLYNYGGCLDFLYKRPGVKCGLGDNKTSKDVYGDYILQLGGYYGMVKEKTMYDPEESLIIKISKDITKPDDEIVKLIFIENQWVTQGHQQFLKLVELHEFNKALRKYLESLKQ